MIKHPPAANRTTGRKKREHEADDETDTRDEFAQGVCSAFSELLFAPNETVSSMRPIGPDPEVGDAIVALPTLVHRGPGGNDDHGKERMVLFFTVQVAYLRRAPPTPFGLAHGLPRPSPAECRRHTG